MAGFGISGQAQQKKTPVEVYYFHFSNRCVTCRAVESEAKKDVAELYGKKVKFQAMNLEEPAGAKKGKELKVTGQMLLIVKGDQKIDLTSKGFMYARSNPEKLKKILKTQIDALLKDL